MRISWTEKNKNEEVMEMTRYKRFPLKTIMKRTTSIFGYITKADALEKQILSGQEADEQSRNNELIMITDDREDWEAMIADVCNRPGK